jgi:hypothetical protein
MQGAASMETTVTDQQLDALAGILLQHGHCDQRTLDRARRAAAEADRLRSLRII